MKWKKVFMAVAVVIGALLLNNAQAEEKWMTGDFHNHTTFTDGSWPMNDLIAQGVIASFAVADPAGLYKQGTAPTAFRNRLDCFINSEHGGIR
jgi:hypothetical protein